MCLKGLLMRASTIRALDRTTYPGKALIAERLCFMPRSIRFHEKLATLFKRKRKKVQRTIGVEFRNAKAVIYDPLHLNCVVCLYDVGYDVGYNVRNSHQV